MNKRKEENSSVIADERIIELYWQRDELAIKETDVKYGQFLYRIAYNILHDPLDSEECRNDTYLGIWNAIPPAKPNVFPAFITQIMRRTAIDRYKEKTRTKRIPSELTLSLEELDGDLASFEYEDDAKELGKIISDYLRSLTDKQQFMFIGRFYMAESVESIARDLGVTASAVYKEIGKLRIGLKNHLERNGVYI